jgi:hypothetical protein
MAFKRFGPGSWFGGGLVFSETRKIGFPVYNDTGSTIAADKVVAVIGYDTTTARPKIVLADADTATHDDLWVTEEAIATGSVGYVYKARVSLASLDTSAASAAGDPVYLSTTAGGFTVTAPTASDAIVQPVGWVLVKSATVGRIHWDIGPVRKLGINSQQNGIRVAGGTITELTGDGAYSISVTLPAGAVLLDIIITQVALWTAVTSATLKVGDTADDDGFFIGINSKTTPAVGTSLRADTVPGGTGDGAYLGDTNGEFIGPATSNFGRVYTAGSIIKATITKSGAGVAGRTAFHVVYAVPEAVTQVVV